MDFIECFNGLGDTSKNWCKGCSELHDRSDFYGSDSFCKDFIELSERSNSELMECQDIWEY